jgi:hypothetical protein
MEAHKDLHSSIKASLAIIPLPLGANATKTGLIIDRQGYGGVEFVIELWLRHDHGHHRHGRVKEGDVTGTLTSVADADLLGTETLASLLAATPRTAGTTKEVPSASATRAQALRPTDIAGANRRHLGRLVSASAILFNPNVSPVANP